MKPKTKFEYRVVWRREGLGQVRKFFQTEAGARAKIAALLWSDEQPRTRSPDEPWTDPFAALAKLTGPPLLQRREVGEWETVL